MSIFRKGFSLVELMIAVAIIGILAAIALPNFMSFQRKSRQSEAKSLLSAYHTALKAHGLELSCFRGNFVAIGFQPEGELYYRLRTAENDACALPSNNQTVDDNTCIQTDMACSAWPGYVKSWVEKAGAVYTVGAPTMGKDFYTAFAGAYLGGLNSDVWSINENKTLSSLTSGL